MHISYTCPRITTGIYSRHLEYSRKRSTKSLGLDIVKVQGVFCAHTHYETPHARNFILTNTIYKSIYNIMYINTNNTVYPYVSVIVLGTWSGEAEDVDGENRLDLDKQAEVSLPDDVQGRSDLGSGQEETAEEQLVQDTLIDEKQPREGHGQDGMTLGGNRIDAIRGSDEEEARADDEVNKLLEASVETKHATGHHNHNNNKVGLRSKTWQQLVKKRLRKRNNTLLHT